METSEKSGVGSGEKASSFPAEEERISLPSDPIVNLLAALVLIATLVVANLAAEIVLPIVLAVVLKLLFEPAMRFLKKFKLPRAISALVLIFSVFGILAALGAAVSGPAIAWASKLPSGVARLQEGLSFLSQPIETVRNFLHSIDSMVGGPESGGGGFGSAMAASVFMGTTHIATSFFEMLLVLFSFWCRAAFFSIGPPKSCRHFATSDRRSSSRWTSKTRSLDTLSPSR